MVFEDFHYADSGLLDFVDHLLEWSKNVPIFVVTLSRPELLEKRPNWGAGKRNFTSLYLEPLSRPPPQPPAPAGSARPPRGARAGPPPVRDPVDHRPVRRDPALCRRAR